MAKELKDIRLYNVRTTENCYHSGIEAKSANEAIAIATKHSKEKDVYDVQCEKIYEDSVYTETSGDKSENDTDIFEIKIRGTKPEAVDKLKKLIAEFIGGPAVEFEYGEAASSIERIRVARQAAYMCDDLGLMVEAL